MKRETAIALAFVLFLGALAGRTLLAPGFYDAHDNLLNLHRLYELERCLADGQIPCRWAPDMAAGYGYPLFNYYPSLPSFVALAFRAVGLSHLASVKATMWLAIATAGFAMFAMARPLLGNAGAAVAAAFYTWAPYRAVDVFVRGAMAEALALALLPLAFFTAFHLLRSERAAPWALGSALVWAALLQTHLGVCLMAGPVYAAWCALWLWRNPSAARAALFAGAHLLAFALAAWFVLPAVLERDYIHFDALTTLYAWSHYDANFLEAGQLLLGTQPWGYGAFRTAGGMSLFVGVAHWLVATGAGLAALALRRRGHAEPEPVAAVALLLAAAWLATLAASSASRPLWDALPGVAFLQFPWRFLGIAALGFAFAAGFAASALAAQRRGQAALAAGLAIAAVAPAWGYFRPSAMHEVANDALVNERQIRSARHGAYDFLPRSVTLRSFVAHVPSARTHAVVELVEGTGAVLQSEHGTDWLRATVRADEPAVLRINRLAFPHWAVEIDGRPATPIDRSDPLGRIHTTVPTGLRRVEARLEDTRLRRVANWISLASLAGFAVLVGLTSIRSLRESSAEPSP